MPSRSELFESLFNRELMRRLYPHQDTALRDYLQDLGALPLLTEEQETVLLLRAIQGDIEAQQQLVVSNIRLVIAIAARYQGRGLSMLDLIQFGNIGLFQAITRFDFAKGQRLSTYAKYPILSTIQRAVAKFGPTLHGPIRTGERIQQVRKVIAEFEAQEIEPTAKALSRRLDWPLEQVIELLELMQKPLSLSHTGGEQGMLVERIAAPPLFLSNETTSPELLSDVRAMIATVLTSRQRLVIENGLDPILEGTQTWKLGHGGSSKEMKREILSIYTHFTIEVLICQAFLSFCSFFRSPCFSYSTGLT